jgi:hypothetical protein
MRCQHNQTWPFSKVAHTIAVWRRLGLGASTIVNSQDVTTGALGSETVDGVLDTVAGKSFGKYVTALRRPKTDEPSWWLFILFACFEPDDSVYCPLPAGSLMELSHL